MAWFKFISESAGGMAELKGGVMSVCCKSDNHNFAHTCLHCAYIGCKDADKFANTLTQSFHKYPDICTHLQERQNTASPHLLGTAKVTVM